MDTGNGKTIKDLNDEDMRNKVVVHLAYAKTTDLHIYRELVYEIE